MTGLLIVNNFVESAKFHELYRMLVDSAKRLGIGISIRRTGEIPHELEEVKKLRPQCDFVLFWDKDVLLAEMLELCGLRVFNSSSAIFACDNKAYTGLRLQQAHVRIPRTFSAPLTFEGVGYSNTGFADSVTDIIGYPVVVKELYGSFGQQVYLAGDKQELDAVIGRLGYKGFLLQEFIASSAGRDVRVNVVGGRAVASMLRYSVSGDFRSNITNGGKMMRYQPSREQEEMAVRACQALGLDFGGVDVMFGPDGGPVICEVNSNPHFKTTLECTGVDMSYEILRYIKERVAGA